MTRFQAFKVRRIHRSQILNATYNPRKIDDAARSKLQANLKQVGLVAPSTWNSRSGNLVGGHQRQACLDALEGSPDYYVDVAEVDMDEATERQQNVFLNNRSAQGAWDLSLLNDLLKFDGLDIAGMGFEALELQVMLDDVGLGMFSDQEGLQAIEELKLLGAEKSKKRHAERTSDELPSSAVGKDVDKAGRAVAEETEIFSVILFRNQREREIFNAAMSVASDTRYVDGTKVFSKLGVNLDEEWSREF